MVKRILSLVILGSIILLGVTQKAILMNLVYGGGIYSILISTFLVSICVFFPVVPFPLLAGIIGAVFGTVEGIFISLLGAILGTMLFFFIVRYGFKDVAQKKVEKYQKIKEYEAFLTNHSFIAILTCRLVPVIPSPVVNTVCGLSKVNWSIFLSASAIGKLPNILVLSIAGANFSSNKLISFSIYGVYILILVCLNAFIVSKKMTKVPLK